MKKMRLNGWQRIGVVASVAWFLVGGFLGNSMVLDDASKLTSRLQLDNCVSANRARLHLKEGESEPYDQVWTPCWGQFQKDYLHNGRGPLVGGARRRSSPIPLA